MAKTTPKAPAAPADAQTTDAAAPAPDTTEANNADAPEQLPDAPAADQAETDPAADGAALHSEAAPEVIKAPGEPEQPPVTKEPPSLLPTRIKLATPYGFYDDDNQLRMWQAGHETNDTDEIELLVTRGAEFTPLE